MKIFRLFLFMTLLTGILYPLLIYSVVKLTMKQKAEGDFVASKGKIVGSSLIAQKFENEKYFWGRPSSIDYNPLPSGGSNLGWTSAALRKAVEERRKKYQSGEKIPNELLFSSGSGLDPHIGVDTAYFQMERVAKARNLTVLQVKKLIDSKVERRSLGFIGPPRINVLLLNIALDEI